MQSYALRAFAAVVVLLFCAVPARAQAVGTGFTFQGRLLVNGSPATSADFQFSLWNAATLGTQIGSTLTIINPPLSADGVYSVTLDFGAGAINGQARWLQIAARSPTGVGSYTTLTPRQFLAPVPLALALPGLQTQETAGTANILGGSVSNSITSGVVGAVIDGGGVSGNINRVTDNYGAIGGGLANQAGNNAGTTSDRLYATVAGGNTNIASGTEATVGGGSHNTASGDRSAIGGGNTNTASASDSTVPGGRLCAASGTNSFAAGNQAKALHSGSFVWADFTLADFSTTAANQFRVRAGGGADFVVGSNRLLIDSAGQTLTGTNTRFQLDAVNGGVLLGQSANTITAGAIGAVVGGGGSASASSANTVSDDHCVVAGGTHNSAGDGDLDPENNTGATVGGGENNHAPAINATVAGGLNNTASGTFAMVPGGIGCTASGGVAFAAGRGATATHVGSFAWADSLDLFWNSSASNEFSARATGGVVFATAVNMTTGAATAGVRVAAGGGSWSSLSDRDAKENPAPVDVRQVLERVAAIPLSTWNYKSQDPSVRHIGPMAQDFKAAFGVGEDDRHITTVDADGVALAAIQGLHRMAQDRDRQFRELRDENAALKSRLEALEAQVRALAGAR